MQFLRTLLHQTPNMDCNKPNKIIKTALFITGTNPLSLHQKMSTTLSLFLVYLAAIILRVVLMQSSLQSVIADSFEVTTPANSWKRGE